MNALIQTGTSFTLLSDTQLGLCASFILPSHAKSKTSYSRCRVEMRTGKLKLTTNVLPFITPSTTYEMDSTGYRRAAQHNFAAMRALCCMPDTSCNITHYMLGWYERLPKEVSCLRLHYGGDVFYMGELLCLIEAARTMEVPVYLQSGRTHLLNTLQGMIDTGKVTIPSNLIIGAEMQCHTVMALHNFTQVYYKDETTALDEITHFPASNCSAITWKITSDCKARLCTKRPGTTTRAKIQYNKNMTYGTTKQTLKAMLSRSNILT